MTLPVSLPLGGTLAAVLAVGIAAFAAGAWLGAGWRSGRDAIAERDDLRRQVAALDAAAVELRRRGLAVAQDFRTAQVRLETTAEGLSHDLASLDAAFAARMLDLESLVAAHPGWGDYRIGADGVLAWNAAAAGASLATAAAAGDTRRTEAAVPGDAAGPDGRQPAIADPQLPVGRVAIPPVPLPDAATSGGAGGL